MRRGLHWITVLSVGLLVTTPVLPDDDLFRRGDADADGRVDVSDAVRMLGFLFLLEEPPTCSDALDADDTGIVELSDALYLLNHLFLGGPDLPPPGLAVCGRDPTADELDCLEYLPADPSLQCPEPLLPGELFASSAVAFEEPLHSMAAGDFNNDGRTDLVVGGAPTLQTTTLLGRGDATFERLPLRPITSFIPQVLSTLETVGDLNGDGNLDLLAVWLQGRDLLQQTLLGRGNGEFRAPRKLSEIVLSAVALGDLDGDGDPDAVALPARQRHLLTLMNRGRGTFVHGAVGQLPPPSAACAGCFDIIRLGDLDADGALDVVTRTRDGVAASMNRGDGTFFPGMSIDSVCEVSALADVDGDGFTDIVGGGSPRGFGCGIEVSFALGDGRGSFFPADPVNGVRAGPLPALGDLTGDGRSDIVASPPGSCEPLNIGIAQRRGLFDWQEGVTTCTDRGMLLADFDGDGKLDLTGFGGPLPDVVRVYPGQGDGSFRSTGAAELDTWGNLVAIADLNMDGHLDLATGVNEITVLSGDSSGAFTETETRLVRGGRAALVSGDFDGDGRVDLAAARNIPPVVWFHTARGAGAFESTEVALRAGEDAWLKVAEAGDLDGDGTLELVAVIHEPRQESVRVLRNDGPGRFVEQPAQWHSIEDANGLALGDLDGDGTLDLLMSRGEAELVFGRGLGNGTFADPIRYVSGTSPGRLTLGDVNRDGHLDVIVARAPHSPGPLLVVHLGAGDGTLGTRSFASPDGPDTLFLQPLVDINADGALDIVYNAGGWTSILRGRNDGTFEVEERYPARGPTGFADLDRDGDIDAVTVEGLAVQVSLNRTRP